MTFLLLIASHFICDTVLQPEHVSKGKHPDYAKSQGFNQTTWFYFMYGHALTHAVGVYLVTGSKLFFVMEWVLHGVIDLTKCCGLFGKKYNMHIDQGLHILCKIIYLMLLSKGIS